MSERYSSYKEDALKAAAELHYGKAVIEKIEASNSDSEIARIMINARRAKFKMNPGENEEF